MNGAGLTAGLCAWAFALAAVLTRIAIAYAQRRGMLDAPGRRRSHHVATPRGGGIGLVVGVLASAVPALLWLPAGYSVLLVAAFAGATAAVAAAGWWDDHHALPVLPRLGVQVLAALAFAAMLCSQAALAWWWIPIVLLGAVWSINLHNFMDGIDGLLGAQTVFVGIATAVLAYHAGQAALAGAALCLGAASAGFLVFNWPPARIFMGDVGSGCAGLLVCMLAAMLCARVWPTLWPLLIVSSCFIADAGLTLAWRVLRGRRWYTAHREHLYQWLVRRGRSHAQTGRLYMYWNLLIAAPSAALATLLAPLRPWLAACLCAGVYGLAGCLWWYGRSSCLKHARRGHRSRALA